MSIYKQMAFGTLNFLIKIKTMRRTNLTGFNTLVVKDASTEVDRLALLQPPILEIVKFALLLRFAKLEEVVVNGSLKARLTISSHFAHIKCRATPILCGGQSDKVWVNMGK